MKKTILKLACLTFGSFSFGQDPDDYIAKLEKQQFKGVNEESACYSYYENLYIGEINTYEGVVEKEIFIQSAYVLEREGGIKLSQFYFVDYEATKTIIGDKLYLSIGDWAQEEFTILKSKTTTSKEYVLCKYQVKNHNSNLFYVGKKDIWFYYSKSDTTKNEYIVIHDRDTIHFISLYEP